MLSSISTLHLSAISNVLSRFRNVKEYVLHLRMCEGGTHSIKHVGFIHRCLRLDAKQYFMRFGIISIQVVQSVVLQCPHLVLLRASRSFSIHFIFDAVPLNLNEEILSSEDVNVGLSNLLSPVVASLTNASGMAPFKQADVTNDSLMMLPAFHAYMGFGIEIVKPAELI